MNLGNHYMSRIVADRNLVLAQEAADRKAKDEAKEAIRKSRKRKSSSKNTSEQVHKFTIKRNRSD